MNQIFTPPQANAAHQCGCGHTGTSHDHRESQSEHECCGGAKATAESKEPRADCCQQSAVKASDTKSQADVATQSGGR